MKDEIIKKWKLIDTEEKPTPRRREHVNDSFGCKGEEDGPEECENK